MPPNFNKILKMNKKIIKWNEWFAGFIDGDGCILVGSKKQPNLISIEATTSLEDEGILSDIKKRFGGSLKIVAGKKCIRWRTAKLKVIIDIIHTINGNIRHNIRKEQLRKACSLLNIPYQEPNEIRFDNSYFAGFFDADGTISITVNKSPKEYNNIPGILGQVKRLIFSRGENLCVISLSQKDLQNIEIFTKILNLGKIYIRKRLTKTNTTKYHWYLNLKEIPEFVYYLQKNPIKSKKKKRRFHLLKDYIELKKMGAHLASHDSIQFKEWKKFCYKWYNLDYK